MGRGVVVEAHFSVQLKPRPSWTIFNWWYIWKQLIYIIKLSIDYDGRCSIKHKMNFICKLGQPSFSQKQDLWFHLGTYKRPCTYFLLYWVLQPLVFHSFSCIFQIQCLFCLCFTKLLFTAIAAFYDSTYEWCLITILGNILHFYLNSFWTEIFSDPKLFWTTIFYGPKIFLDLSFFGTLRLPLKTKNKAFQNWTL